MKTRRKYKDIKKIQKKGGGDYPGLLAFTPINSTDVKKMKKIKTLFHNNILTTSMVVYKIDKEHIAYINLYSKLMQPIPFSCRKGLFCDKICGQNLPTYMEIFIMIQKKIKYNLPIMIYGGAVRDYIQQNYNIDTLKDIDINYNTNYNDIIDFLSQNKRTREHCYKHYSDEKKRYILFGDKYEDTEGRYLEGFQIIKNTNFNRYSFLESRCNSLSIIVDVDNDNNIDFYVIDFFNDFGINDAINKIFCASFFERDFTEENLLEWVSHSKKTKALWRMFYFMLKGYTVEPNTAITIYQYWWENRFNSELANRIEWDKIWDILPIKDVENIFGRSGFLNSELTKYRDIPGIPTYDEFIEYIQKLGYIIKDEEGGHVEANIPTKEILNRLEKKSQYKSFQHDIMKTDLAVTLQSLYRRKSTLKKMRKTKQVYILSAMIL
jgi:hypothetical protein